LQGDTAAVAIKISELFRIASAGFQDGRPAAA